MGLKINTWGTHLKPEEALTVIECLDQLRDVLIASYGDEIRDLLQEASTPKPNTGDREF